VKDNQDISLASRIRRIGNYGKSPPINPTHLTIHLYCEGHVLFAKKPQGNIFFKRWKLHSKMKPCNEIHLYLDIVIMMTLCPLCVMTLPGYQCYWTNKNTSFQWHNDSVTSYLFIICLVACCCDNITASIMKHFRKD